MVPQRRFRGWVPRHARRTRRLRRKPHFVPRGQPRRGVRRGAAAGGAAARAPRLCRGRRRRVPGPGTALQLAAGSEAAGRLLVASHHGAYERDYVTMSDDGGESWRTVAKTFAEMDEAALTQLPNGSVLLNMRHRQSPSLGRAVAVSRDGGATFGPLSYDAALVSPVCQASVVSFDNATYFSNPASNTSRRHLSIRKSTDSAGSWSSQLLVEAGASGGYSCLVKGALRGHADSGGLLYEAADK